MKFFNTSSFAILLSSILQLASCTITTTITSAQHYLRATGTVDAPAEAPTSETSQWTDWASASDALDSCDDVVCASSSIATPAASTTTSSVYILGTSTTKATTRKSATTSSNGLGLPTDSVLLEQVDAELVDIDNGDAPNPLNGQNSVGAGSSQGTGGVDNDLTVLGDFLEAGVDPNSITNSKMATSITPSITGPRGSIYSSATSKASDASLTGEILPELINPSTTGLTTMDSNVLEAFGVANPLDLNSELGDVDEVVPIFTNSGAVSALSSVTVTSSTSVDSVALNPSVTSRVYDKIPEALSVTTTTSELSQSSVWETWSLWTTTLSADAAFDLMSTSIRTASTTTTTTSTRTLKTTLTTITKPALKAAKTTSVCYSTSTKEDFEGVPLFSVEVVVPCPAVESDAQLGQHNLFRGRRY